MLDFFLDSLFEGKTHSPISIHIINHGCEEVHMVFDDVNSSLAHLDSAREVTI